MANGIGVLGIYVHDQDEALAFYVGKLGFKVHADQRNGDYRWLTVKHPNQPSFELGLFLPQEPVLDASTAQTMREMVAKGAMPPLVLVVDNCRAAYEDMRAKGVEFIQEPVARYGGVDANFRDPSGNAWKMIEVGESFDLIICDHRPPKLDGPFLARAAGPSLACDRLHCDRRGEFRRQGLRRRTACFRHLRAAAAFVPNDGDRSHHARGGRPADAASAMTAVRDRAAAHHPLITARSAAWTASDRPIGSSSKTIPLTPSATKVAGCASLRSAAALARTRPMMTACER
ncbi:MAG: VOC family protein [Parvularculaceae bacterium]|nr:VOC family protein [Parvularculaceae bacterium]